MGTSQASGSEQPLTSEERRQQAEREIGYAADRARANVQDRYRVGSPEPEPGSGGTPSGVAFASVGSGGGYNLSPDELATHIERFERIADRIANQTGRWEQARDHANPPSGDPPAGWQAKATRESCEIGRESNLKKLERANEFIDAMKSAHGGYQVMEDDSADVMRTSDTGEARGTGGLYKKGGDEPPPNTGGLYEKREGK